MTLVESQFISYCGAATTGSHHAAPAGKRATADLKVAYSNKCHPLLHSPCGSQPTERANVCFTAATFARR